jgi:hypothetical protein
MYSLLDAPRKEIRLLHVHPGAWGDDIECHLETVSLDDNPKFHAISYVWGDPRITLPITIDGQPLALTQNLFNGLQRLRPVDKTLIIFADAACIDQSNLNERSQQVQLMGEIYASAEEVFIWLGYGRELQAPVAQPKIIHWIGDDMDMEVTDSYFKRDHSLVRENGEGKETEDVLGLFVYLGFRAMDRHLYEIPFFDVEEDILYTKQNWSAVIRAAETLLSNPWWTRIWVVQETVLARHATVVYRNITIPWTVITDAVRISDRHDLYCCQKLFSSLPYNDKEITAQLGSAMFNGAGLLKIIRQRGDKLSLGRIMRQTHLRDAADIRDKVFGVLGLVEDWQGASPILPDYNLSPKEVYMQATLHEIESTDTLEVFIGTTISGIPGVPSWVTEKSAKSWAHNHAARARIGCYSLFSAADCHKANVENQGDILIIDGFKPRHRISQVSPILSNGGMDGDAYVKNIMTCRRMAGLEEETRSPYPERQPGEDDFWRIMVQDCWMRYSFTRDIWGSPGHSENIFQRLGNIDVAFLGKDFWSKLKNEETRDAHTLDERNHIRGFSRACNLFSFCRRFFITEDGHMGLGPPEMLPGDSIAILLGSNVPLCLRSVPDAPRGHYTLVGDTYVHGLMDEEGVPSNWADHVVKIHLH